MNPQQQMMQQQQQGSMNMVQMEMMGQSQQQPPTQHFGTTHAGYVVQQESLSSQMSIATPNNQPVRMMRPMSQMHPRMAVMQQQGRMGQPGVAMSNRSGQSGVMFMPNQMSSVGQTNVMPQQPQVQPCRVSLTEHEMRMLSMLPEEGRQKFLSSTEEQRKQLMRKIMIEMQNKANSSATMSARNQQLAAGVLQQQPQQWPGPGSMQQNDSGAGVMIPPGQLSAFEQPSQQQQQQHSFAGAQYAPQAQYNAQQRFVSQQRMGQQQQHASPSQHVAMGGQQSQLLYRMSNAGTPSRQPLYANVQMSAMPQNQAQGQSPMGEAASQYGVHGGLSPATFAPSAGRQTPMYGLAASGGSGPSPGSGVYSQQEPSPGFMHMPPSSSSAGAKLVAPGSVVGGGDSSMEAQFGAAGVVGIVPAVSADDLAYREKIRELQVYLDHMKRTLEQQHRDGNVNQPSQNKIQKFIDILEGRVKVSYEILLKCEEYLRAGGRKAPETNANVDNKSKIFQPFLDSLANIAAKSGPAALCDEIFKRTFDFVYADIPDDKRIKLDEFGDDDDDVDSVVGEQACQKACSMAEREVESLRNKFSFSPLQNNDPMGENSCLTLSCMFKHNEHVPLLPPIVLRIPPDYPNSDPIVDLMHYRNRGVDLFDAIEKETSSKLSMLGATFVISNVLSAWETAVENVVRKYNKLDR